jgi:hypothetical protein
MSKDAITNTLLLSSKERVTITKTPDHFTIEVANKTINSTATAELGFTEAKNLLRHLREWTGE